jgi:putative iron-regulated protein
MKTSTKTMTVLAAVALVTFSSCKKDDKKPAAAEVVTTSAILADLSVNVNAATYTKLSATSAELYTQTVALSSNPSAFNLQMCQQLWKSARATWEQSEGFLYGPVATELIDPRIDTWPVDFNALEGQLASGNEFNETYINGLDDALKGFHPIEYLLFGENGDKTFDQFTTREKEYLGALAKNLRTLTAELAAAWELNGSGNFMDGFRMPGANNPYYETKIAVYEDIVNAMSGICDEVANGKIGEPFLANDPSLEESPYSSNSITDFTNNMRSVQNVYEGKFITDGKGLQDFVRIHNLSLHNTITAKINAAISSLNNITDPFGTAITSQPVQVGAAITAINDLKTTLEEQLLPFVQQYVVE